MWSELATRMCSLAERMRPWLLGPQREVTAFRVLALSHLVSMGMYYQVVHRELVPSLHVRIEDSFFPPFLQAPWVAVLGVVLPAVLLTASLFVRSLTLWRVAATTFVACCYLLLLHQRTFPEAWVAGNFWASLYTCWFSWRVLEPQSDPGEERKNALALGQLCICFLYFAGAVGKLTELYQSGEAFEYWGYPGASLAVLHKWFDSSLLAKIYANMAVVGESTLALSIAFPPRLTFALMFCVAAGMLNGGTPRFFDAIGPLFGIACAGWLLSAADEGR